MLIQKISGTNSNTKQLNSPSKSVNFTGEWSVGQTWVNFPHEDSQALVHIYRPFENETQEEIQQSVKAKFGFFPSNKVGGSDKFAINTGTQLEIGAPINKSLKKMEYNFMDEISKSYKDITAKYIEIAEMLFKQGADEDIKNAKGALEAAKVTCNISCLEDSVKNGILNQIENLVKKIK